MKYYIHYYKDYNHYIEEEANERKLEQIISKIIKEYHESPEGSSMPIIIKGEVVEFEIVPHEVTYKLKKDEPK